MTIADIESELGVRFSGRHRQALLDPTDPIHEACDFLVPDSPHELLRILDVNRSLHDPERYDSWPRDLVAFASNGCADYFAYRVFENGTTEITYIDPDLTIAENRESDDRSMDFPSFEAWHSYKTKRTEGQNKRMESNG